MILSDLFKDKNGNIIIAQRPNWPLWSAISFYLLKFMPIQGVENISFWGVLISLLYWSYLEVFFGDSPFRRILGLVIAVMQFIKLFSLF